MEKVTYHYSKNDRPDEILQCNYGYDFGNHYWPIYHNDVLEYNKTKCVARFRIKYKNQPLKGWRKLTKWLKDFIK